MRRASRLPRVDITLLFLTTRTETLARLYDRNVRNETAIGLDVSFWFIGRSEKQLLPLTVAAGQRSVIVKPGRAFSDTELEKRKDNRGQRREARESEARRMHGKRDDIESVCKEK